MLELGVEPAGPDLSVDVEDGSFTPPGGSSGMDLGGEAAERPAEAPATSFASAGTPTSSPNCMFRNNDVLGSSRSSGDRVTNLPSQILFLAIFCLHMGGGRRVLVVVLLYVLLPPLPSTPHLLLRSGGDEDHCYCSRSLAFDMT